jgi:carbon-monoxide dehydrogenase small subunit
MRLTIELDGRERSAEVDPRQRLVEALRECFGALAPKIGCGTGDCGACTIEQDGLLVKSCLKLAVAAQGSRITTLEGVAPPGELTDLQRTFWERHAFQCGFCISGMVLCARELLEHDPDPSDEAIRGALDANLCRCTGYQNIVAAVRDTAAARRAR